VSAVLEFCQDLAAWLADRPGPISQPGGPQTGRQPGALAGREGGNGNTTAFPARVEIFGPRA
jgi:hypothetical protein